MVKGNRSYYTTPKRSRSVKQAKSRGELGKFLAKLDRMLNSQENPMPTMAKRNTMQCEMMHTLCFLLLKVYLS